jgi:hypothetical protein
MSCNAQKLADAFLLHVVYGHFLRRTKFVTFVFKYPSLSTDLTIYGSDNDEDTVGHIVALPIQTPDVYLS